MGIVPGIDVTSQFLSQVPAGIQKALYVTGSPSIVATAAELAANPNAVLIVQSPVASPWDKTGDVLDYESGAVLLSELATFVREMQTSFNAGTRPGQREPCIYCSQSNVTAVVNALIAGGVKSGVNLWLADWNLSEMQAAADVVAASGPFPIVAVQYQSAGIDDLDVFDSGWLGKRSVKPGNPPFPPPPGQWNNASNWQWRFVTIIGSGIDGVEHLFTYNFARREWVKQV